MKKFMMMAMMMAIATSAKAMTYSEARAEALFLTDKMAYELRLSNAQYDAVYEINLDYMLTLMVRDDIFSTAWARRNSDLRYVLTIYQYEVYQDTRYFYRPVYWSDNMFTFRIYGMYRDRDRFYTTYRPIGLREYRGGHNVGSVSYYMNREFNKPIDLRPAMMGRPKSTWTTTVPVTTNRVATTNHSVTTNRTATTNRTVTTNRSGSNVNTMPQRPATTAKPATTTVSRSTNTGSSSSGSNGQTQRSGHFGGKR
ncbi:MAG: hypothetical protein IJ604_07845 [Prevotella sp.]|nr:hypothetical protein [Prevotella sp.]